MDNSKLKQSELQYSCTIGDASVNIFTGRLLFECPDICIGVNGYGIDVSHVYNSLFEIPATIHSYMGTGWKLNIQQYLFLENDKYVYMDMKGYKHYFESIQDKFYDTSGLGLTLTKNSTIHEISDELGNKLIFKLILESNVLIKTISAHNPSIIKYFDYDSMGKLIAVYDGRTSWNKLIFDYYDTNGLLKSISCINNNIKKITLNYFYDSNNYLLKISKTNEYNKDIAYFRYINNQMSYAVCAEDRTTCNFIYLQEKVCEVKTGVVKLNALSSGVNMITNVGDEIICGDEIFYGDNEIVKDIEISGLNTLGIDIIRKNEILYCGNKSIVADEKQIKIVYYFNKDGIVTSIFEADSGNSYLRTFDKTPGVLMSNEGPIDEYNEYINAERAYLWNTKDIINTENLFTNNLFKIKEYRRNKYPDCINYSFSFWLKCLGLTSANKAELTINSITKIIKFDGNAENSWQQVKTYIQIPYKEIDKIELKFSDSSLKVEIADFRLCCSSSSICCIKEGDEFVSLDDIDSIWYINPDKPASSPDHLIYLTSDNYITENDLKLTYLSIFKSNLINGDSFILSYCNNTKKVLVSSVLLETKAPNAKRFLIDFDSNDRTLLKLFNEVRTPCDDIITHQKLHIIENKQFGSKVYNCIRQVNETNNGTYTESYFDLKGNILLEQDEYKVQIKYEYDYFGNLTTKIIQDELQTKILVFETSTSNSYITEEDSLSNVKNIYDETLGNLEIVDYNGKNEDLSDLSISKLTTKFGYNSFRDKLLTVDNNIGEKNYIIYAGNKVHEVKPIGWNENNEFGFKICYDNLWDPSRYYLTYKDNLKRSETLLFDKDVDRINSKVTTNYYRSLNNTDTYKIEFDKFGKRLSITDGGKITTFKNQNLYESLFANKIEELYDSHENRTYKYNYDEFNNVTGYEVKEGDTNGSTFLSIKADKSNIVYNGLSLYGYETEIVYDETKFINPRIKKSMNFTEYTLGENGIVPMIRDESIYDYDELGRINYKEHKVADGILGAYTSITENTIYKAGTFLKDSITTKIDNPSSAYTEYCFSYLYDSRGNIQTSTLIQSRDNTSSTESVSFTYDKGNRLLTEHKKRNGIEIGLGKVTYTYNKDGSINSESDNSGIKQYQYSKGRLISRNITPTIKAKFAYDNLGNCTHYMRDSILTANMEWERGKLLKRYYKDSTNIAYSYNTHGIRFKKVISDGVTITYYYDGDKLLGEKRSDGNNINYIYDIEGISGFMFKNKVYPYNFVKDALGNVIGILDRDMEIAHYEYDAWGNCTVTKDDKGIGTLNPIRWKCHYYDAESGLYYINGRYYSSLMKSFISTCNIQGILYNISKPGTINPYTIGNPLYFSGYASNIFTSIPLVPEAKEKFSFWGKLGNLGGFGRFIIGMTLFAYGTINNFFYKYNVGPQFSIGTSVTNYGIFMMASTWNSKIKADMDRIGWDPFSNNPDMTYANQVSFYKGQSIVIHNLNNVSSGSFGIMFLKEGHKDEPDTVKHEWGHFSQLSLMGPLLYAKFVAIPSLTYNVFGDYKGNPNADVMYYSKIWERGADYHGGVNRNIIYDPFWTWSNFVPW